MSRVHDALRRAGAVPRPHAATVGAGTAATLAGDFSTGDIPSGPLTAGAKYGESAAVATAGLLAGLFERVQTIPWNPNIESHIIDADRPGEAPTEEFRTLRTRLNHIKGLQKLDTLVVTSPSPAEGKSFTAANLAVVQAHLQGNPTILCDFDFRRPLMHHIFQIDRTPGLTDYLQGKAALHEVIRRLDGTNLYIAPAGSSVLNPLELLNLPEVTQLFEHLPKLFSWVILDSPPLLFAADANLLSTLTDGTLLVVRLGHTTIDSVTRAIQSMSHNNVVGVVANGAKRGELYSKYTYYHSYYYEQKPKGDGELVPEEEPAGPESD
jgi:receptor protein-tyrosine kinase